MALAEYERIACSDLYYVATGIRIESHYWNEKAAALLYDFIYKLSDCSKGFAWLTKFPAFPVTSRSSVSFLNKVGWYLYQVWQEYKKIEKNHKYNARCRDLGKYGSYPSLIESAIMGF